MKGIDERIDKTDKIKNRWLNGSFTVEAALLMTVILPVVISLIYAAFFLHDRAVLQGAACEVAAMGSNLSEERNVGTQLDKLKKQLISSRLLGTENVQGVFSMDQDSIAVTYSGIFKIPGMIVKLFGGNAQKISCSWNRELYHPADIIRKIRGLEYMADAIKG